MEKQQRLKRSIGQLDSWIASPRSLGYRARIQLTVGPDGRLGYHRPRSHDHVPLDADPLARSELNDALRALPTDLSGLTRVEPRSDGERVVLNVWGDRQVADRLPFPTAIAGKPIQGDPTLWLTPSRVKLRVSPGSFYQVNLEVNERLVHELLEEVERLQPESVLDLYAGIGNLSLPVAQGGVQCTLIDRECFLFG